MPKSFPRRPSTKSGGKPIDRKFRFLKAGVMIFELTKAERAKLVLGYNIKVTVNMRMEHNPGAVSVQSGYELTEQTGFNPGDRIAPVEQAPQVVPAAEKEGPK